MKKLIILGVAFLCLSLAPSVLANDDGPVAKAYDFKYVKVHNFNFGTVSNHLWTNANTGWNWSKNFMWWGGDSDTGNAVAGANVSNMANASNTAVAMYDSGSGPVALNAELDSDNDCHWHWPWCMWRCGSCGQDLNSNSSPVAIAKDKNKVKVTNFNFGSICNQIFTNANSGHNWTFGGDSDTGKANASANVSTNLNSSNTGITVVDSETGPIAMNIEEEGGYGGCGWWHPCFNENNDNGDALAVAIDKTSVKVKNKNFGFVGNFVLTTANSGKNFTMFGESDTGNANSASVVSTTMNGSTTTVNVTESGSGPLAANMNGGSKAVAVEDNSVKVENTNVGTVKNDVMTSSNTGSNTSVKSTDSDTGDANATSTVSNNVNSTNTSVTVNDSSNGPTAVNTDGSDTTVEAPCVGGIDVCGSGGTTAANVGEEGTAVAKDENEVKVDNDNTAFVSNDVDTSANTGDNTTCGSKCGGETETDTGNATATSTVSNTVNTNTTSVVIMD